MSWLQRILYPVTLERRCLKLHSLRARPAEFDFRNITAALLFPPFFPSFLPFHPAAYRTSAPVKFDFRRPCTTRGSSAPNSATRVHENFQWPGKDTLVSLSSFSKICRKSSVSTAKLDRKFGKFPKSRRPNERRETKRKAIVLSFPSLEIVNGGANSILEPRRATYTESERINCSRIDRTILIPCNYARSPRRPGPQQLVSTALGNR